MQCNNRYDVTQCNSYHQRTIQFLIVSLNVFDFEKLQVQHIPYDDTGLRLSHGQSGWAYHLCPKRQVARESVQLWCMQNRQSDYQISRQYSQKSRPKTTHFQGYYNTIQLVKWRVLWTRIQPFLSEAMVESKVQQNTTVTHQV